MENAGPEPLDLLKLNPVLPECHYGIV